MDGHDREGAGYEAEIAPWRADPEAWWGSRSRDIAWPMPPTRELHADFAAPDVSAQGRWFADGRLNTCHNVVHRHVAEGRGAQPAIIHDSPITGRVQALTCAELLAPVAALAGALAARGVASGDRVVIYMPMVPEAAIAMLACARFGAVHSVVSGGFARTDDAKPRAVIAASCGLEPGRVVACKPLCDAAWNAEQRFHGAHLPAFPKIYDRSEAGMVDESGHVWVVGRTDDIINLAGQRLPTGAMEEVVACQPGVAKRAVVGAAGALKGQVALGLVVLKAGAAKIEAEISHGLAALARERIGPVAALREARVVARPPKTRSGKIRRATLRKLADGPEFPVPAMIGDPAILDEIRGAMGR